MTAEELARIERRTRAATSVLGGALAVPITELNELIALARRALELESALKFLTYRGHHVICATQSTLIGLLPGDVLARAKERGWSPTAKGEANDQ